MKFQPKFIDIEFEPLAFKQIKEGDVSVIESGPRQGIYILIGKTTQQGASSKLICRLQKLGDSVESLDPKTRMELAKLVAPKPLSLDEADKLLEDKN